MSTPDGVHGPAARELPRRASAIYDFRFIHLGPEGRAPNLVPSMDAQNFKRGAEMRQSIYAVAAMALTTFLLLPSTASGQNQQQPMGFFITSVGPGDGANLGGLEGADQH
jgi:hypothetical protein